MTSRLLAAGILVVTAAHAQPAYTTWNAYGGGQDSMQYSALKRIDKSNVEKLELAWSFTVPDHRGNFGFNPLVVDGVMFVLGPENAIVALDATTGKQVWTHPMEGNVANRGITYWESKDRSDRRLFIGAGQYMWAINARSGVTINT